MTRARWTQLPALAWTHARAFGGAAIDECRGEAESPRRDDVSLAVAAFRMAAAVLVLPISTIVVVVALLRRGLYASKDARSMLVVKRYALPPELLAIASVIFVPLLLVLGALMVTLQVAISLGSDAILQVTIVTLAIVQWSVPVFACWVFLGGLVLASRSLLRKERSIRPVGDETPSSERWVVESLAARQARDGTAAFRLAVRTVSAMPPERVLVALARTVSLRKAHVRLGFRLEAVA